MNKVNLTVQGIASCLAMTGIKLLPHYCSRRREWEPLNNENTVQVSDTTMLEEEQMLAQ